MPSVHDRFKLVSDFEVAGDQVHAVPELVEGLNRGDSHQVLLGVTGSGKTFTMAQVLAQVNRPTLVMAHNKTLAAQLYQEFKRFFPDNAVEYFVSYYDYYQPEAYFPATDSYIEKEATINDEIDRMRLSATRSLFERRDVIIVASVSCIYGLGLARGVPRPAAVTATRPADRSRPDPAQAGRDPVRTQRHGVRARHVPCSRRHRRSRTVVRRACASNRSVWRRGGRARLVRSTDGEGPSPSRQSCRLPEVALRNLTRPHKARGGVDQEGARRASRAARIRREAARGPATASADDVRPRDDPGDGYPPRNRELRATSHPPSTGSAAAYAARLPAGRRHRRR